MNKLFKMNAIAAAIALTATVADAQIFIKYENIPGDTTDTGEWNAGEWFVADSFSFGVEREMKESGEKGGTQDINIGVGELQDVTIGKALDTSTPKLARLSLTGRSLGTVEICVTDKPDDGPAGCYLRYKLDRCFVKSWSTSGDADDRPTEEVAFYYNKIAFSYTNTDDGTVSWERKKKKPWPGGERLLLNSR